MTEEKAKSQTEKIKGQSKETEERTRETTGEITGQATETVAGLTGPGYGGSGQFHM